METETTQSEVSEQVKHLRREVVEITEKFYDSSLLLRYKDQETHELKEKLLALEIAVQHLFEKTHSASGCCSGNCNLF